MKGVAADIPEAYFRAPHRTKRGPQRLHVSMAVHDHSP